MKSFSLCSGCGCKTSRLILCDSCANPTLKLAKALQSAAKKPAKKTGKARKKIDLSGYIRFTKTDKKGFYKVTSLSGSYSLGIDDIVSSANFDLSAGELSLQSFDSLVKNKLVEV